MRVLDAQFLRSATGPDQGLGWPSDGVPEVAFVGRSNVGKSTLLGALTKRKGLVRTSNTPGRTRLINFFDLQVAPEKGGPPRALRFVDLPGYGYAKVSKDERQAWFTFVEKYLGHRPVLKAVVLLLDARRGPEYDETELAHYASDHHIGVICVATKADKLAKHERIPAAEKAKKALGRPVLVVSATDGDGLGDLWRRIAAAIREPGDASAEKP